MRKLAVILLVVLCYGCAVTPYPEKRPLTEVHKEKIMPADAVLLEDHYGIGVKWYAQDSSAAGAQYGLLGALTTAIIDAIANAGPSSRAEKAAGELGELVSTEYLNASFENALLSETVDSSIIGSTDTRPSIPPMPSDKLLSIDLSYSLSQEASQLKVVAIARYADSSIPYVTPYTFEKGKTPKAQKSGAIYYNTFTYESDMLTLPEWSLELEDQLASQINERYLDADGNPPAPKSDEHKNMEKELDDARDGKLSKSEMSIFLIRSWLADDAMLVKSEIEKSHSMIAKHLVLDMQRMDIPSLDGQDTVLETLDDGRKVIMLGSTTQAGSIVSKPANVTELASWGNSVKYPEKNLKTINAMRKAARKR